PRWAIYTSRPRWPQSFTSGSTSWPHEPALTGSHPKWVMKRTAATGIPCSRITRTARMLSSPPDSSATAFRFTVSPQEFRKERRLEYRDSGRTGQLGVLLTGDAVGR